MIKFGKIYSSFAGGDTLEGIVGKFSASLGPVYNTPLGADDPPIRRLYAFLTIKAAFLYFLPKQHDSPPPIMGIIQHQDVLFQPFFANIRTKFPEAPGRLP